MSDFLIKQLPYDLSSHAGLALIGKYFKRINFNSLVDPHFPVRSGIANSDILKSYLGLLCLGKNDFDAIEGQRQDRCFIQSLGLRAVPSSPTLRQRLDTHASSWFELAEQINTAVLGIKIDGQAIDFGALPCGYVPLDIDTFVMDNSDTAKEHVGRTYTGVDGYCPLAAYLGTQGFCLELALRPGTQHSACDTEYNLERVLPLAAKVTPERLLLRADAGFDSARLLCTIDQQAQDLQREIAWLVKWNPRTTPVEAWAEAKARDAHTPWGTPRPGKRQCTWSEAVEVVHEVPLGKGEDPAQRSREQRTRRVAARRIYRLSERTIDKHGQPLLLPEYTLEGWTTNLPETFTEQQVIELYAGHGTHEQFHAEFKTDMDLQRLPSGKFDTNYLVCALAAVAMNLLRLVGQHTLQAPDSPVRHPAQRRRVRTVMQEMMYKAARLISHARQWVLGLGANDRGYAAFSTHWQALDSA